MIEVGSVVDKYRIEALIGEGGMAAVYRARHVALDSLHAVKVLYITSPEVRRRLILEGRVQANLRHPNIVSVTDVLELGGAPALVMEFVDGPSVDDWLREATPTLHEALAVFRGVVRGMAAAHERGVIHRDLKPANIVLADDGDGFIPKITDFGLVKSLGDRSARTLSGMAMGTPEYMAPEQIRDASDVDQRVDMFALGCILYELVCGCRAFAGPDKVAVFNAIVAGTYAPPETLRPDLPDHVRAAIEGLLEVDRDRRIADCERLTELLFRDPGAKPRARGPVQLLHLRSTMPELHRVATPSGQGRMNTPVPAPRSYPPEPSGNQGTSVRGIVAAMGAGVVLGVAVSAGLQLLPLQRPAPQGPAAEPVTAATVAPSSQDPLERAPSPGEAAAEPQEADGRTAEADPRRASNLGADPGAGDDRASAPGPAGQRTHDGADPSDRGEAPTGDVPAATSDHATVAITGDARRVWLVQGDRRLPAEGPVPAGTWRILADFGGPEPAVAGEVELRAGERVTLVCSSFLFQCRRSR